MTTDPHSPDVPAGRPAPRRVRGKLKRALRPIGAVAAILYFLIDALFLSVLRPIGVWLGRLPIFARLQAWIGSLGPYPSLALFLIPVIVLEPVKPVAAYLIATKHFTAGLTVIVVGEILKIIIVERLFHMTRDKLMMIPAFAWTYNLVNGWLEYLRSLPAWQAITRRARAIKSAARRIVTALRARLRRFVPRPARKR